MKHYKIITSIVAVISKTLSNLFRVTFVRSTFAQSLQPYIKNFKYLSDENNDWRENPKIKIHCYSEKGKGIMEF